MLILYEDYTIFCYVFPGIKKLVEVITFDRRCADASSIAKNPQIFMRAYQKL